MKLLYAPWRSAYTAHGDKHKECVFCHQLADHQDEHYFIIKRYTHCFVMLNLHPYNAGHCLLLPNSHVDSLDKLLVPERSELIEVLAHSAQLIQSTLACDGINMGLNQGKAAGGSIPEHVHLHIVPRWWGDTNFLAALANTKPIGFDLHELYKKLYTAFAQ